MLAAIFLVAGCMTWAAADSWTGVVSDSHCGAKHAAASDGAAKCVAGCVHGGASYVFVSDGKVYNVDAQDKFKGMDGKEVKVTGTVKGDTITVESVAPASS
jgi:hypothetical protein